MWWSSYCLWEIRTTHPCLIFWLELLLVCWVRLRLAVWGMSCSYGTANKSESGTVSDYNGFMCHVLVTCLLVRVLTCTIWPLVPLTMAITMRRIWTNPAFIVCFWFVVLCVKWNKTTTTTLVSSSAYRILRKGCRCMALLCIGRSASLGCGFLSQPTHMT